MGRGARHRDLGNVVDDVEATAQFWLQEELWERDHDPTLGLCSGKIFNFLIMLVYAMRRCMSARGLCYVDSAGEVYPCSNCSASKILSGGNLRVSDFEPIWEDPAWPIRGITWDSFADTCRGCAVADESRYFCSGRCPSSSYALHRELTGCGSSEFQKLSILRREELFREHVHDSPAVAVRTTLDAPRDTDA
jgi:radical SAM protein with 4Fe4S-binding SPASM domain